MSTDTSSALRLLTPEMMEWASKLDVIDTERYPLPGAIQNRTWDPDPRLRITGAKDSDKVTWYEHVATVHHTRNGIAFVVFQETMDALLARQKDPTRFPKWLMEHPVKATELRYFMAVVSSRPDANVSNIWDWLKPIEDYVEGPDWVYDALSWFLLHKGVITERFYGRP